MILVRVVYSDSGTGILVNLVQVVYSDTSWVVYSDTGTGGLQ